MGKEKQQPYISDASQPNAGRVYDYFLGGHHYFEIDRKVAEQLEKQAPFISKMAKLTRWFLGEAIRRSLDQGFTMFIDFASGLPTEDHIHSISPPGIKVVYSDIDPITVSYGKKIIGNNPIVKYETCNAETPEKLLESDIVKAILGNDHKVAVGFNGICWFLTDEQLRHAMKILYEWVDTGSILFFTDYDCENISEEVKAIGAMYANMNQGGGLRSKEAFIELSKPWKVKDPGFLFLEEWIGISPNVSEELIKAWKAGGLYGGFLIKE